MGTDAFTRSYTFDPAKKVTRIETIIDKNEIWFMQINFYHHQKRLVSVGDNNDYVRECGGRKEVFEIADDEHLIGCKLDQSEFYFEGVSWIKMKVFDRKA